MLKDAIIGFAIGDALGVPVEFQSRGSFTVKDMQGYGTHDQLPGTWSDDTSMTIATCASIKRKGCIDYYDLMQCFHDWYNTGAYTADGTVFDIGNTTFQAINKYRNGEMPIRCGISSVSANGNGSLMRILPLAFMDSTKEEVCNVSKLTHAHEISQKACCIYVDIAKRLLKGESFRNIMSSLFYQAPFNRLQRLETLPEAAIQSSGYVVHTLEAALWCVVNTSTFEQCVLKAVNLGDDTDTTAAVAGGLSGIIYGYDNIPRNWIAILRNIEAIEQTLFM
ncbi:ADP-ribosylglycohydrolase family protein [Ruminococcus sp. OA3]|uniref:ADP-ribosylglycohydrolase family protein n=1 Tax=Ruminococcus sp. OA3 TaxID=2914164 RepID=UPI001F054D3B|nr:ADP-ribosylglycohydrolase family protein [Ruminococcus sp. OA3]MCH1982633.1 ADP-ribosylglycohydrolase family protein [Ruminococcus sp. OA3]